MKPPLPLSLKIVACLFLLLGFCALIEMVTSLLNTGQTIFNIVVFGVLIGLGLLERSNVARIAALVMVCTSGALVTGIIILALSSPGRATLNGQLLQSNPSMLIVILLIFWACFMALSVWQYRVLTNPAIKALFHKAPVS